MRDVPRMSRGSSPSQQLRADRAHPQLGVGEVEIVLLLGDVVGELVAEREADPPRRAVGADQVEPDDLRLLAAVEREGRADQRLAGRRHDAAVALVEPFRLHAVLPRRRLAALEPELEHPHAVGERRGLGEIAMHLVAPLGRAQMRQPGAGDQHVRGSLGMIERRQQAPFPLRRVEVDHYPRSSAAPTSAARLPPMPSASCARP